jgi:hypothetical protein
MPEGTITAEESAERVRSALNSGDLTGTEALLSPDVPWGPEDARGGGCQNRRQLLNRYRRGRVAGVRAQVTKFSVQGSAIPVGLNVHLPDGEADWWQVLTVGPSGVSGEVLPQQPLH